MYDNYDHYKLQPPEKIRHSKFDKYLPKIDDKIALKDACEKIDNDPSHMFNINPRDTVYKGIVMTHYIESSLYAAVYLHNRYNCNVLIIRTSTVGAVLLEKDVTWAQLIAMGVKDIECRDAMPASCRKIFVAASGSKVPWNELPPFVQETINKLVAAGKMPAYKDLPSKCIIGHVDIVKTGFEPVDSIWGRDWPGMKYTLRNAELLDEPLYGLNKATPYFYNVEGYNENNLPASHKVDLTGIDLPK